MIKAKVEEVRAAYKAFLRIAEENRLPQKPAWRVSRLLGKLKPVVRDFEQTQLRLFRDAGGVERNGGIVLEGPARMEFDTDAEWQAKLDKHNQAVNDLNTQFRGLNAEEVEIDYDALPVNLFEDAENVPAEKRMRFSPNDFADAGPFIKEE